MLNKQQFYLIGQIQSTQTGGQLYIETCPYGERSLPPGIPVSHIAPSYQYNKFIM